MCDICVRIRHKKCDNYVRTQISYEHRNAFVTPQNLMRKIGKYIGVFFSPNVYVTHASFELTVQV